MTNILYLYYLGLSNSMFNPKSLLISISILIASSGMEILYAQKLSVGTIQDQQMRLHVLLADSIHFSVVNRPFSYSDYQKIMDSDDSLQWWNRNITSKVYELSEGITAGIHSPVFKNTVNTRFPYSQNNGAAWYGRGMNSELFGGFYIRSSYLTIDLQPHLIYQQNIDFLSPRFLQRVGGKPTYQLTEFDVEIDLPYRFGPDPFTTFDWGSSSIRGHYKKWEAGLSSEPLWWGPVNQYPLIMSNNAPGVHHFFFNSRSPMKIPYFGKLSFQWVLGYPQESGYYTGENAGTKRFINALNLAYQPSLFENLTLGATRVYHIYEGDGFSFDQVSVILGPLRKVALIQQEGEDRERQERNQAVSIYAHLRLPKANAEIYAEFFREDHSFNFRDLFNQPHHNSAYAFGFQKVFFGPWANFFKMNLEITNLTITQLQQVRPQAYYYSHSRIQQGHTNRGQVLGAAIGPGSNSQYIDMEAYRGNLRIGMFLQRVVVNDTFHFQEGSIRFSPARDFGDYFRHRIDLNVGLNLLYGPGPFYIQSNLIWTKAYNYGRFDLGDLLRVNIQNYDQNDRTNMQFQIGITYVFR